MYDIKCSFVPQVVCPRKIIMAYELALVFRQLNTDRLTANDNYRYNL